MKLSYEEYTETVRRKLVGIVMNVLNTSTATFKNKDIAKSYKALYNNFVEKKGTEEQIIDQTVSALLKVFSEKIDILSKNMEDPWQKKDRN